MKVIFLDFDGALYGLHDFYDNGIRVSKSEFEKRLKRRIKILGEICKENDAKIVIESSYKDCIDEETLETDVDWIKEILDLMKQNGIEVIGRTPNLKDVRDNYDGNPPIWKEDEILGYLKKHPEIDSYCIIDDDDLVTIPARERKDYSKSDLNKVRDHLLEAEYLNEEYPMKEALQESHKEKVKLILQKKMNKSF